MRSPKPNNWVFVLKSFPVGAAIAGLVAASWIWATVAAFRLPEEPVLFVLAFAGTFLVYAADQFSFLSPEDVLNNRRTTSDFGLFWWIVIASLLILSGAVMLSRWLWQPLLFLTCVAALYVFPVICGKRLKEFGSLKTIWVIVVWGLSGVVLPILFFREEWPENGVFSIFYRMVYILPNVLISDYLDRSGDGIMGIKPLFFNWSLQKLRQIMWLGAMLGIGFWTYTPFPVEDLSGLLVITLLATYPLHHPLFRYGLDLAVAWPMLYLVF